MFAAGGIKGRVRNEHVWWGSVVRENVYYEVRCPAHKIRGGSELKVLKSYTQMVDFEDFRLPYRFESYT